MLTRVRKCAMWYDAHFGLQDLKLIQFEGPPLGKRK